MNQKSVFYNSLLTVVRQVLSAIFGLCAMVLIARVLGNEGQGQYTLAILLPTLLFTFFNSGISISTVYFIGQDKFKDEVVYSTNLLISIVLSLVSIVIGLVIIFFFKHYFFESLSSMLLLSTLFIIPILFVQRNLQTIFQAKENFHAYNIVTVLNQLGLFIFSVLFVWVLKLGIYGAVLSFGLSQLLMLVVLIYFLNSSYNFFWPNQISLNYAFESFKFGLKGHISNVISFINYRVDIFLIAFFVDDTAVGVYSVAVLLAERIWLISQSVSSVLYARVSNLKNDLERDRFTSFASRMVLFITFIGALIIALCSDWIFNIFFGPDYIGSIKPFLLMLPGIVLFSLSKVIGNDFTGRGFPEINTYIALVISIVNVILNVYLIPMYGIIGAALSTSISYILDVIIKSYIFCTNNKVSINQLILIKKTDITYLIKKVKILKL